MAPKKDQEPARPPALTSPRLPLTMHSVPLTESTPLLCPGPARAYTPGAAELEDGVPLERPTGVDLDCAPPAADEFAEKLAAPFGESGSVQSAVFNLSNTIVGAGIMGLPVTLKILGIPLGLLVLCAMGAVSEYSLRLLLSSSLAAKAWSFNDLMERAYGRRGEALLRLCVLVNNTGILVVYLLILGDVISGSDDGGRHYPGLLEEWSGGASWWTSRAVVLPAVTGLVIAPLCALPNIDSLQYSSGLSLLLALAFVLITVGLALLAMAQGRVDWGTLRLLPAGVQSQADIWQLFSVIPTMATSYTCHYNFHPVYAELSPPREGKMRHALRWSLGMSTAMYCVTALFGYTLFGSATYADVLANFNGQTNQVLNDLVRILYAVHLMLVYPVIHFSLRAMAGSMLFPNATPLSARPPKFALVTALLVGGTLVLALLVPHIQFAFQFVGSAGAATIAFTIPGLIALSPTMQDALQPDSRRWGALLLLAFGLLITCTGLSSNVHALLAS